jgi:death-on-curing protein
VRFLTLAEALVIAEAVTGISPRTLRSAARMELLDSALHAPRAGFDDDDFHPSPSAKAAVLCVRLARNHQVRDHSSRLNRKTFVYLRLLETTFAAGREIRSIGLIAEPASSELVRAEIVDGHERNL